jgi:hypothetical protein
MEARIRRKLSMVERVLQFSKAHAATDPGYTGVVTRLEALVARGTALAELERNGDSGERVARNRRAAVRRTLSQLLRHLDRVGAVVGRERPELVGAFDAPENTISNRAYLAAARDLSATATANQEVLVKHSLGEGFLEALIRAIAEFSEAGAAANSSRDRHVGARGELPTIAAEAGELVEVLDGFNRARFAEGSAEIAAWESARNIFGPVRRQVELTEEVPPPLRGAGQAGESVA